MYAVIETGGKQYKVQEGDVLFVDRISAEEGSIVTFEKVLALSKEGVVTFGKPLLDNVMVEARVLGHGKHKKIIVFKYKPKKNYRRKQGHRQPYTRVQIERIVTEGASAQELSVQEGSSVQTEEQSVQIEE
ncbi:MAG: 50S ribosomal protein L21 [Firmicutes bacterium]|nr:50S ribosomal protein L21 [Bacillota bacterium]